MPEEPGPGGRERTIVEYERLNGLGRAVFVAGALAGVSAKCARRAVRRVRLVARETRRAFRAGLVDRDQ